MSQTHIPFLINAAPTEHFFRGLAETCPEAAELLRQMPADSWRIQISSCRLCVGSRALDPATLTRRDGDRVITLPAGKAFDYMPGGPFVHVVEDHFGNLGDFVTLSSPDFDPPPRNALGIIPEDARRISEIPVDAYWRVLTPGLQRQPFGGAHYSRAAALFSLRERFPQSEVYFFHGALARESPLRVAPSPVDERRSVLELYGPFLIVPPAGAPQELTAAEIWGA